MNKIHELFWFTVWHVARLINKMRNFYYAKKFEYNFKRSFK